MLDYPKFITLKWVIGDWTSASDDFVTHISGKGRKIHDNLFEVLHLDHVGPLTKDAHGNEYILVIIDAFSRWVELFPLSRRQLQKQLP